MDWARLGLAWGPSCSWSQGVAGAADIRCFHSHEWFPGWDWLEQPRAGCMDTWPFLMVILGFLTTTALGVAELLTWELAPSIPRPRLSSYNPAADVPQQHSCLVLTKSEAGFKERRLQKGVNHREAWYQDGIFGDLLHIMYTGSFKYLLIKPQREREGVREVNFTRAVGVWRIYSFLPLQIGLPRENFVKMIAPGLMLKLGFSHPRQFYL